MCCREFIDYLENSYLNTVKYFRTGTSLVAKLVKNLPAMQEIGFDPWIKKTPLEKWQPTPLFLPGESHQQRSVASYRPWGRKSQM